MKECVIYNEDVSPYLKTNPPIKINNTDRQTGCKLCSKLTIKIPE